MWKPRNPGRPERALELLARPVAARGDTFSLATLHRVAVLGAPRAGGGALAPHGEGTSLPLGLDRGGSHPCALVNIRGPP